MGWFILGTIVGGLITYLIIDPQGLREKFLGVKDSVSEHAPSPEQTAEGGKVILAFVRKYWFVLLVVVVLLVMGISSLISQANQTPQVQLGMNTLMDKCGVAQNVNITVEDVRRGQIVIGSKPECRRIVNLKPGKHADLQGE